MIPLACPVRGCTEILRAEGPSLRCSHGHVFDRAREGYWNLLQPQDRKSAEAGDARTSVEARRRWLARGFASALAREIHGAIDASGIREGAIVLDAGCGEGTMTCASLAAPHRRLFGVDLSVPAIRLAARRDPAATWIVANADRRLPIADGGVDIVASIFGRRNPAEFARVLRPGGRCIAVVPGLDDLAELREAAQGSAERRDRVPGVIEEMSETFRLVARRAWRDRRPHDRDAIDDALAMSYRGARRAERERTEGLASLDVTLEAEILLFEPSPR